MIKKSKIKTLISMFSIVLIVSLIGIVLKPNPANALNFATNCYDMTTGGQITFNRISSDMFYIDEDTSPLLQNGYVAYSVTTDSSTSYNDVWIRYNNTDNPNLDIASTEDGYYHIGPMSAGETKFVYLYMQAVPTSYTYITLDLIDGYPYVGALANTRCSAVDNIFDGAADTIQANANKVISVSVTPPTLGGDFSIVVKGQTGIIGASDTLSFTPAALASWLPDEFTLKDVQIVMTGANNITIDDALTYQAANPGHTYYTATYTFSTSGTTSSNTPIGPIAYIASGQQTKHTAIDDDYFPIIPPVPPASNKILLTKSAYPSSSNSGGTVTYTLTLANTSSTEVIVDSIKDILPTSPATPSYISGSSIWDNTNTADPLVNGSDRIWSGPFAIPAGQSKSLSFDVSFPSIPGTYTNRAVAYVGTTQIDQTLDTSDNSPSVAIYGVTNPGVPNLSSSTKKVTDINGGDLKPGDTLNYQIEIKNTGSINASLIKVVDDISNFTENITNVTLINCGIPINLSTSSQINLTNISVATNMSCIIGFDVNVKTTANNDDTIINTATISPAIEGGTGGEASSEPMVVKLYPSLTVTKTSNAIDGIVLPGQTVEYTVSIVNAGEITATGVDLTDTPGGAIQTNTYPDPADPAITLPYTATISNLTNCGPDYAVSPRSNLVQVANLTIETNSPCQITYSITVDPNATGGQIITNSVDIGQANEEGNDPTPVGADKLLVDIQGPNLATSTKSVEDLNAGLISPGDNLRYTITLINTGEATANGVRITDTIPEATENISNLSYENCGNPIDSSSSDYLDLSDIQVVLGLNCIISFEVSIKDNASNGESIGNSALISVPNQPDQTISTPDLPELKVTLATNINKPVSTPISKLVPTGKSLILAIIYGLFITGAVILLRKKLGANTQS